MLSQRQLFQSFVAPTSPSPLAIEIVKAEGLYLYGPEGQKYLDFISGISVSSIGHCHPSVVEAVRKQAGEFMHLMVYGEYIHQPQVQYSKELCEILPDGLDCLYLVNSGSEATEGVLKLAKRVTGRTQLISFKNAYHGSTHGSLSIMGSEVFKSSYRPLLPDTLHLDFNSIEDLGKISEKTAAVIVEPIQGEAGAIPATQEFLSALRKRCTELGVVLIFDEIQSGFGRTGKMFAFEHYNIVPDVLTLGKAMGGGMPIGGFVASREMMQQLSHNPVLGHITTFGGHPVSAAAALATLNVLRQETWIDEVEQKSAHIKSRLEKEIGVECSGKGLLLAINNDNCSKNLKIVDNCLKMGLLTDWFLFADNKLRIAPPLSIGYSELDNAINLIIKAIKTESHE